MAKAISVRLDDEAQRALRILEATGLSQSAAIRSALLASAGRVRKRSELVAEAASLEADEADRAEMLSIGSMMESMRAEGVRSFASRSPRASDTNNRASASASSFSPTRCSLVQ